MANPYLGDRTRPIPTDFAYYAEHEGTKKLQKRYGTSQATIERWRQRMKLWYKPKVKIVSKPTARPLKRQVRRVYRDEAIEDLSEFSIWDYRDVLGL